MDIEIDVKLRLQSFNRPLLLKIISWFTLLVGICISGVAHKDAEDVELLHNVSTNSLGAVHIAFTIISLIAAFVIMIGSICMDVSGYKQKDVLFHLITGIIVVVSTLFLFGAAIELENEVSDSPLFLKGWRSRKPYRQNHRYAGMCFSFAAGILYLLTAREIRKTYHLSEEQGQSPEAPPPQEGQSPSDPSTNASVSTAPAPPPVSSKPTVQPPPVSSKPTVQPPPVSSKPNVPVSSKQKLNSTSHH